MLTTFEYIESGPLGLKWTVVPTRPVRRAFVVSVICLIVAAI